ncbi:alpha-1A adrenergic receptor [Exaiptasia diaphana]|uniref:G-protein coupled receptors family 1 profile domain-containing protein n=1 Tax=Exaiptasia diaphana TaxID=2652724 RepID=A0A913YUP9_EXADI|nr:alpha-1A adrenergic receptor [Exaiptasia diaphana]XP_020914689.1 alpha-1A adrenergic receptor [Exaiptasia diaphana]XP_020914770.1 alpha-1A adrenergic receptor [Exaiptasia diaphana]XP_020914849.1 alpha-1A adrenergic receptor [Exaiptasia diaphana]XP_020914924.1 alpha-1A adrenergic receptor [Exaiptasia diaphana]XP_020914996.1 alpha-1A adrenergic receptor [Exaiptasia diaphana]XP_020915059.1 alpha-1A adrenergic receptor [Exaiptasia diaphana]XP_020915131.1 alpha-1A adrenergic receptor [Exaiptas
MISNISGNITTAGNSPGTIGPANIAGAFFVGLLMLATLFGNFLVWASFISFRELRTKCNYFIISLAVADIMVALLAMPFWFILQLEPDIEDQTALSPASMFFWSCIDIFCGTASIMNLAAVSADRHLAITSPYTYHKALTSFRAIMILCFVWFYATTISLLRFAVEAIPNNGYQFLIAFASFFVPLMAMLVMYARIFAVARRQARLITKNLSYKTDIKAAKTIAVVIGAFVVCWLPFFVIIIGYAFDKKFLKNMQVYSAIKWMEYLNSCLNPIIYCCLNRTYRGAFKKLFQRWRKSFMKTFFSKYSDSNEDDNLNTTFLTRNAKSPTLFRKSTDSLSVSKTLETNGSTAKKSLITTTKDEELLKQTPV